MALLNDSKPEPDIWEVFEEVCSLYGNRPAYKKHAGSNEITYKDFNGRVKLLAGRLQDVLQAAAPSYATATNSREQTRVAVILPNCPQYLELFYANAGLRVVTATLNTRSSADEIMGVLSSAPCPVLVCSTEFSSVVDSLDFATCGIHTIVWVAPHSFDAETQAAMEFATSADCNTNVSFTDMVHPGEPEDPFVASPLPSADMGLQLFFTSGTTGKPKAIVHSHRNIYMWSKFSLAALDMSADQTHCCAHFMPMFHVADNAFVWSLTMIGAKHVFPGSATDVISVLRTLSEEKITVVKFAPTTITIATGFSKKTFDKMDLSALKWIWSGGAALADGLRQKAEEMFKCEIICGYGMTESTGPCAMSRVTHYGKPGYMVIPGVQVQVQNSKGKVCQIDEDGEIMVQGPTVFNGYLNLSERENKKVFNEDGWFHSGDMGRVDANNMLWVTGRIKDMIIVAGENVYAAEVEAVIAALPEVKQVAAFGVPDKTFGEVVEVAVTFKEDMTPLPSNQIIAQCRAKLADFKVPKRVHELAPGEMPVTAIGKPVKADLKKLIEQKQAALSTTQEAGLKRESKSPFLLASASRRFNLSFRKPSFREPTVLPVSTPLAVETVTDVLQRILKKEFGLDVAPSDDLFSSGLTSMQAVELLSAFEAALEAELSGSLLYEYPTLEEIEEYLEENNLLGKYSRKWAGAQAQVQLAGQLSADIFARSHSGIIQIPEAKPQDLSEMSKLEEVKDIEAGAVPGSSKGPGKPISQLNPLVMILQLAGIVVRFILVGGLFFAPLVLAFEEFYIRYGIGYAILAGPAFFHGAFFLLMVSAATAKWILVGRVRPGEYRLWGWFYIRWLAVHNMSRWLFAWAGIYRSTKLYTFFYRLFGLRVGYNVIIDSQWITDCDLVSIGDETLVSRDCNIQPSEIRDGKLILKKITIGSQCMLHHGAIVTGGAVVPDRAVLTHLQVVSGRLVCKALPQDVPIPQEIFTWQTVYQRGMFKLLQFGGLVYLGYIITVVGTVGAYFLSIFWYAGGGTRAEPFWVFVGDGESKWALFWLSFMTPFTLLVILPYTYTAAIFVTKWTIIGSFQAYQRNKARMPDAHDLFRRWLLVRMTDWWWFQSLSRTTVMSEVNATLYRLLGAKIGSRVYFNSPYIVEYDLLEVEDDSMVAWDIAMLPNRLDRTEPIKFEKGACCANNVVLCDGATLGPNCLVGDCSYGPSGMKFPGGTLWTNRPRPVCVGRTHVAPPEIDMAKYWIYQVLLAIWQLLMPTCVNLAGTICVFWTKREISAAARDAGIPIGWRLVLVYALPLGLYIFIYMICLTISLAVAKWVFLGRFKACQTPKFTSYTYISWVALDSIIFEMEASFLNDLRGTAFLPIFMRLMGARVGQNVCMLGITGGVEFDLKRFDDNVCINFNAKPLSHSIEEHQLSYSQVTFLEGATIGTRAIVEMNAVIPAGEYITPLSAVHAIKEAIIVTQTEVFEVAPPVRQLPQGPKYPGTLLPHVVQKVQKECGLAARLEC